LFSKYLSDAFLANSKSEAELSLMILIKNSGSFSPLANLSFKDL
jgi:hypothetical protein